MNEDVFDEFGDAAVREGVVASTSVPEGLSVGEAQLYRRLLDESRGRLEQEFLPLQVVQQRVREWLSHQP
jgi:hypothetical protein